MNRSKQQKRKQDSKIAVDFRFAFIHNEGSTKLKRFFWLVTQTDVTNVTNFCLCTQSKSIKPVNKNIAQSRSCVELHDQTRLNPQPYGRDPCGACDWRPLGYVFSGENNNQSRDATRILHSDVTQCGIFRVEPNTFLEWTPPAIVGALCSSRRLKE